MLFLNWLFGCVVIFFQTWAEIRVIFMAFKIFPAIQVEVLKRTQQFNEAVIQPVKYAI
jgi:hypothetical protein